MLNGPNADLSGKLSYKVQSKSLHQINLRVEFDEPDLVSEDFKNPDVLVITLRLS